MLIEYLKSYIFNSFSGYRQLVSSVDKVTYIAGAGPTLHNDLKDIPDYEGGIYMNWSFLAARAAKICRFEWWDEYQCALEELENPHVSYLLVDKSDAVKKNFNELILRKISVNIIYYRPLRLKSKNNEEFSKKYKLIRRLAKVFGDYVPVHHGGSLTIAYSIFRAINPSDKVKAIGVGSGEYLNFYDDPSVKISERLRERLIESREKIMKKIGASGVMHPSFVMTNTQKYNEIDAMSAFNIMQEIDCEFKKE